MMRRLLSTNVPKKPAEPSPPPPVSSLKKPARKGPGAFVTLSTLTLVAGGAGAGYLYLTDRKQFNEYYGKAQSVYKSLYVPEPVKKASSDLYSGLKGKVAETLNGSSSSIGRPAPSEPVKIEEKKEPVQVKPVPVEVKKPVVAEKAKPVDVPPKEHSKPVEEKVIVKEKIVFKEDPKTKELVQKLQAEIVLLEHQSEEVNRKLAEFQREELMNHLKILDNVVLEFQKSLDLARNDVTLTQQQYEQKLADLQRTFQATVDAKVGELTDIRISQLNQLGRQVDKLRSSTSMFGNHAVLNGHILDLVKLINTLPHTATFIDQDGNTVKVANRLAVKDEFVSTVLDSMPKHVDSEESLRSAYLNIKPRLYQISLVPKDGGLVSYLISRILSPFMFRTSPESGNQIEKLDSYIKQGRLMEALDCAVKLNDQGWNGQVMEEFLDRLRSRVEFDIGLQALEAHLGLISSRAIVPQLHLD